MNKLPDTSRLRELFDYKDGRLLKYIAYKNQWKRSGGIGRSGSGRPRRTISIDGVRYLEHRVIAKYHGFDCDDMQIDHINGDTLDNRIENLRVVSCSENLRNMKKRSEGFGGVTYDKSRGKWMAFTGEKTGFKNLGRFDNIIDAVATRLRYNRENGYTLRHGR